MMKATFLLLALAAVLAVTSPAAIKSARANLNIGYIAAGDRLLFRGYIYKPAIANTIQYEDFVWRGNATNAITAIQASEIGGTQYASAVILGGGYGWNNVSIRFTSARGWGYYYLLDIWGR